MGRIDRVHGSYTLRVPAGEECDVYAYRVGTNVKSDPLVVKTSAVEAIRVDLELLAE